MTSSSEHSSQDQDGVSAEQKFRSILDKRHGLVFSSGAISILLALIFGDQEVGLPLALFALTIVADFVMGLTDRVLDLSAEIGLLREEMSTSSDAYSRSGRMMKALEGTSLIDEEALVSFVEGIEAFDREVKEPEGTAGNDSLAEV